MVIRTQCKGREYTGVDVGANNVRRYFPRRNEVIEIQIDHLQIQCGLQPGFWNGHPEISDPRLGAWFESKNFKGKRGERPVPLVLIPSGKNCFRLKTIEALAHPTRSKALTGPLDPSRCDAWGTPGKLAPT
jgi:hypothetical protein